MSSVKQRIQAIKQTASFPFSEDVLMSIILCLSGGCDKHLILTARTEELQELKMQTEQIFRHILGLSCSSATWDSSQTTTSFLNQLMSQTGGSAKDCAEHIVLPGIESAPTPTRTVARLSSQRSTRSIGTISSTASGALDRQLVRGRSSGETGRPQQRRQSGLSFTSSTRSSVLTARNVSGAGNRDAERVMYDGLTSDSASDSGAFAYEIEDGGTPAKTRHRPKTRSDMHPSWEILSSNTLQGSQALLTPSDCSIQARRKNDSVSTGGGLNSPSPCIMAHQQTAQAWVIEGLAEANEVVHTYLLEKLLARRQMYDKTTTPNRSNLFVIVVLLPQTSMPFNLPGQLLDRFFISYAYKGSVVKSASSFSGSSDWRNMQRMDLEILEILAQHAKQVHVHNDMQRYMRDIVVGLRMHRLVKRGVTARAATDLEIMVRFLAAVFQRTFVTPELVFIAAEKVFSHRLVLQKPGNDRSIAYGTSLATLLHKQSQLYQLITTGEIIADVLQAVQPPV